MTVYGAKTYGSFKYGLEGSSISVYPFTANSFDYGRIKLSWVYPGTDANFTDFIIIRNPSGFPITADNGDLVYFTTKSYLSTNSLLGTTAVLADAGRFYDKSSGSLTPVYTTTVVSAVDNESVIKVANSSNIKVGQLVSGYQQGVSGDVVVKSINQTFITLSRYVTIPAGTSLTFTSTFLTPGKTYYYSVFVNSGSSWIRVGNAIGTSIKNYGTADKMYESLPMVYTSAADISSSKIRNQNADLYSLLRTVSVEYDLIKTKVDNAKNRYDISNIDGRLIPALMDQMGFSYESGLGAQQGRRILKNAANIYLNKGSIYGVKKFVSAFTGYEASLASAKNLFLTLDCSSFENSSGFWSAASKNAVISNVTTATEIFGPVPYFETNSPSGYPNSTRGYLKVTSTLGYTSTTEITYGASPDRLSLTGTYTVSSIIGEKYVTLTTSIPHGFQVGQNIVISGMNSSSVNGIKTILSVPDTKSFTITASGLIDGVDISPVDGLGHVTIYDPTLYGIPITSGSSYAFSIYSWAKSDVRSITLGVRWYDAKGTEIVPASATSNTFQNSNVAWVRILSYNMTAPNYSVYAVPYIQIDGMLENEIHYFDAAQFEELSNSLPTTYFDARRIDIYLTAPRINRVVNPSFEVNTNNWTPAGHSAFATNSSSYPTSSDGLGLVNSAKSGRLTANSSSSSVTSAATAVNPNKYYTFSGYVKSNGLASTVSLQITWKDSGGSTISSTTGDSISINSTYSRQVITEKSPSNAASAVIVFNFTGSSGDYYYVDSVLFEESAYANPYFDGSMGYSDTNDIMWEQTSGGVAGTASNSRSLYYPNKVLAKSRLDSVLSEYLPIGSTWALFIGKPLT